MKHKPIRLDWDELEVAFTNHDEEIVYYLDLVTGKVIIDGEGEDDDFSPNSLVATGQPAARDDSTRAYVKPMSTEVKLEWMKKFLGEKDNSLDKETNAELKQAFESDNAPEALGAFLRSADEARDVWYLYRSDRLHEYMQSWLGEREIKPIDPAPWA
ncbi:MAG: UPF0158 family protein [Acidobacteriota bacterium]